MNRSKSASPLLILCLALLPVTGSLAETRPQVEQSSSSSTMVRALNKSRLQSSTWRHLVLRQFILGSVFQETRLGTRKRILLADFSPTRTNLV